MHNNIRRALVRAAAATVAGALALATGAGAALAADDPSPLIDPKDTGSITIHKFDHETTGLAHDGTVITDGLTGFKGVSGVKFTVEQVVGADNEYDLTTNEGWTALTALTPENAAAGLSGQPRAVTTDSAGVAVAGDLPVGVYLVTETEAPVGAAPVAPFLVTIPMTDPANRDAWLYNVHVYPKNSIVGATKTVDDDPTELFHNVVWTILADIPDVPLVDVDATPTVAKIDGYKIVDKLDTRLHYDSTKVSLTNGATLANNDYTLAFDSGSNTVTVEFTEQGLGVLGANHNAQVKVEITTKAKNAGVIPNTAIVYPNLPSFTIEPGQPGGPTTTDPVETKWGSVAIHKIAKGSAKDLPDATFGLYLTKPDADAANPQNALQTGTTDADGMLTFTGLRYSDFADGNDVKEGDPGYQTYWIAELNAPAGYELLAAPIEVSILKATDPATGEEVVRVVGLTVENVPEQNVLHLPLTGGSGAALLTVAGALVIGGTLLIASRRRTTAQA
ncbi:SpaH/EbpB family LPXTG-anchored major pilin [Xylanimonas ulmi]|uniref:LPXTG-motif cell wall-anchored protein/fimbrial isopeptide formation D2 family protein n=1 Tax=Xylanimonas ulmi TaxID=228973 RepID=A0A4Q7M1C9_9MICO|nr:SpaH/EbpB family LPXTG-anchored major pilin [Xylanibacterium ulmi]RZS60743.1 LPXTG-motif cell wall-anchored protein/fimbrial isopeptide formation D2 family protein [Xylanibacterium ulmi]